MLKTRVCAKEKLTTEELRNKMLLHAKHGGIYAWYVAAFGDKINAI